MQVSSTRVVALATGLLAGLASGAASANYVYTTIDFPGAIFTDVRGITNNGQIVGYTNTGGDNFGFVYSGGTYTPLPPAPPGLQASAVGINDAGTIAGNVNLTGATVHTPESGFVLSGGVYSIFTHPGWANTAGRAIGPSGLVTGIASNPAPGGDGTVSGIGYIYNPATGSFTDIVVPGFAVTLAQGMNAAGQVVGNTWNADAAGNLFGGTAYLREANGTISTFNLLGAPTRARGINDTGLITGFIGGGVQQGFVGTSSGFEFLAIPGAHGLGGQGINNAGQVAGLFTDAAGNTHGFIATPASLPTGTTASGAYTFSVAVVPNTPIFIDPELAVGYDYAVGLGDPLFASLRLPIGIGDNLFELLVEGQTFDLPAGVLFDFIAHGFANGVSAFRVTGIEVSAGLDPANPLAFPTELTFVSQGLFTGTMTPITVTVPEPSTAALLLAALVTLAWPARRWLGRHARTTSPA
jgi:probable HAF family extracellular repeat protein